MRPSGPWCWFLFVLLIALLPLPRFASSQTESVCGFADSAIVDTMLVYAGAYHEFGEDSVRWPHEFDLSVGNEFKAFRQVFRLYLTDHISGRFSTPQWEDILHAIMNNDTTSAADDVFSNVWDYFARQEADANAAYAGVRFRYYPSTQQYTNINIYLHHLADINQPYSTAWGNTVWVNASNESVPWILGQGIAHEMQHLCFHANGDTTGAPGGYRGINESLSTVAEYFLDGWRHIAPNNLPYDASFMDSEPCDMPQTGTTQGPKYNVYKAWMLYLYELCKGSPYDPTDDVLYRWIRTDALMDRRLWLDTLADLLWSDSSYDWLGGADPTDRLNQLYANFVAAKFCNAPDFSTLGEFGIGSVSSVTDLGFFTDNNPCTPPPPPTKVPDSPIDCPPYENSINDSCWNVRVILPSYELTGVHENAMTTVSDLYHDGDAPLPTGDGDGSVDSIDVYNYGTDYVIFRASSYFQDGEEHELRIKVSGRPIESGSTNGIKPVGWVIGYSSNDDLLQLHPERLVFLQPVEFAPGTTTGDSAFARTVIVTDFGRAINAVVLAVGSAGLRPDLNRHPSNGFAYQYEYGVLTPEASSRRWEGNVYALGDVSVVAGGTLDIAPDTRIMLWPSDLAEEGIDEDRIELNIEGTLLANGTAAEPILFESWQPTTTEDWVGFYFDNQSGGGTFDNCVISRAEYAIESFVPLTVTNTTIQDCRYVGVLSQAGGAVLQGCTLTDPGSFGIFLTTDSTVVRNTVVDGAIGTALNVQLNAGARVRNSQFLNSNWGLFHRGTSHSADIDSSCTFNGNQYGVYFFETDRGSFVKRSVINNNMVGIFADNADPTIWFNSLSGNVYGVECVDASPVLTLNTITSDGAGIGVVTSGTSKPDIGRYPSTGHNTIAFNWYHVYNDGTFTIYAQNNCWGRSSPPCAPQLGLIYGPVVTTYATCCTVDEGLTFSPEEEPNAAPRTTALNAIVPNPFNPTTSIHYDVAKAGNVEIRVYDVSGRFVRELVSENKLPGSHQALWNGTDKRGSRVASGIYFVRMSAGGEHFTKKMVLLK